MPRFQCTQTCTQCGVTRDLIFVIEEHYRNWLKKNPDDTFVCVSCKSKEK